MKTKLIQIFKKSSYWLSVVTLGIILGLSIQFAKAWTEPTDTPPDGNVGAPINVGDNIQYKAGTLGIGKILHGYSNAIFDGNVGIGTTSPMTKLDVRGTIRQDTNSNYDIWIQGGASTTSGAARNLALLGVKSSDRLYLNYNNEYTGGVTIGGNVGIGTSPSSERLNVSGNARVSGNIEAASFNGMRVLGRGIVRMNSDAYGSRVCKSISFTSYSGTGVIGLGNVVRSGGVWGHWTVEFENLKKSGTGSVCIDSGNGFIGQVGAEHVNYVILGY